MAKSAARSHQALEGKAPPQKKKKNSHDRVGGLEPHSGKGEGGERQPQLCSPGRTSSPSPKPHWCQSLAGHAGKVHLPLPAPLEARPKPTRGTRQQPGPPQAPRGAKQPRAGAQPGFAGSAEASTTPPPRPPRAGG